MNRTLKQTVMFAGLLAGFVAAGWAQNLSIPNYQGRSGTEVVVPLEMDDATGLATLHATVNFDQNILKLISVQTGPLGSLFELVWDHADGVLDLFMARDEALASGRGRLVFMTFRVNEGAEANLYSDLALADFALGDESGVVAVARVASVCGIGGRLAVTDSRIIDNGGNGLTDEWELANGLDPFSATADGDADEDGLTNAQEEQLGLDPLKADTDGDGHSDWSEYIAGTSGTNRDDYLALAMEEQPDPTHSVFNWLSVTGRIYSVLSSTNLLGLWSPVPLRVVDGNGAEQSFTNDNATAAKVFFRLKVELE